MNYLVQAPVRPLTKGPGFPFGTEIRIRVPVMNVSGPEKVRLNIEVWEGRFWFRDVAMIDTYTEEAVIAIGETRNFDFLHTVVKGPNWEAGQYRRDLKASLEYHDGTSWVKHGEYEWEDIYHVDVGCVLIQDYTYPYADQYYGDVEECTFTFSLGPEQIPGTDWLREQIIQAFAEEVAKQGSQMIKLQVYEDTTPLLHTEYKVIATSTASPVAWALIIVGVLAILFILGIIGYTILEIITYTWGTPDDGVPPEFVLVQDHTYPYAEQYYGEVEECTFNFMLGPEQIPGTTWLGERIAQVFAEEVAKQGSQMIKLQIYEDTTPVMFTAYKVIATSTASPLAWWIIIGAVLFIIFVLSIAFTVMEIRKFIWGEPGENGGIVSLIPLVIMVVMMSMISPMMGGEGEGGIF